MKSLKKWICEQQFIQMISLWLAKADHLTRSASQGYDGRGWGKFPLASVIVFSYWLTRDGGDQAKLLCAGEPFDGELALQGAGAVRTGLAKDEPDRQSRAGVLSARPLVVRGETFI